MIHRFTRANQHRSFLANPDVKTDHMTSTNNMLHYRYGVTAIIFLLFLCIVQLLRFQAVAHDSSQPQPGSGWRDWMWPAYNSDLVTTDRGDDLWEGNLGNDWKEEVTTVPTAPVHTSLVVSVTEAELETLSPSPSPTPVPEIPEEKDGIQSESKPASEEPTYSETVLKAHPLSALNTTFHVSADIYDPKGPRPHQVVLVTATDGKGHNGGIENILEQTAENRKAYCIYHGYKYHFVNISKYDLEGAHPVWKKLPAIVEAFNTYPDAQWVFFLDLDAIIMSPKQDLNSLVLSHEGMRKALALNTQFHGSERSEFGTWTPSEPDYDNLDLLIAQDHNGINAGSFFLRRSKYTQWLVDVWADPFFMKMNWPGKEQDALLHFVKHHPVFRSHLGLLKQRIANAYAEGDETSRWINGDFIVHFAGCWVNDKCEEWWQKFWNIRGIVSNSS
ncbi:hypothetical protein DV736_g6656, partial [Chaetothyriales sp. CBS 134916]